MKQRRYDTIGSLLEEYVIKLDLYVPLKGVEICNKFTSILTKKASFLIPHIEDIKMDMKNLELNVFLKKGESSVVVAGFKEIIIKHKLLDLLNKDAEGIFLVKEINVRK